MFICVRRRLNWRRCSPASQVIGMSSIQQALTPPAEALLTALIPVPVGGRHHQVVELLLGQQISGGGGERRGKGLVGGLSFGETAPSRAVAVKSIALLENYY